MIDSHCHLELFARNGTLPAVLERARDAGVDAIICVGTEVSDWKIYRDLARENPSFLHYTVGIHPCNVDENWRDAWMALSPYFTEKMAPVALGEIGLDYFHLPRDAADAAALKIFQKDAFQTQLELAAQLDCPVVIHSRNAFNECVTMIDDAGVNWQKVVFHCFSEGAIEIGELNKRGGRGSFTGILTYPSAQSIRDAALAQGLDFFMIETDAPYLAPQPVRGKQNEPAHVRHTAEFAAKLFNLENDALIRIATENTKRFFGI